MNNHIIEGSVDYGDSMSIIVANVVKELGIVHLVIRLGSYKKSSRVTTQIMGGISDFPIHVREVICKINFMDNDVYCLD
jgi:hypothetical protein